MGIYKCAKNGGGVLVSALSATLLSFSAGAGIKYWDNPAYKAYNVGDYVQDGLVLHYDGILNQGVGKAHSDTTTTWVNLATPGTHDLSFYAIKSGAAVNWQRDGYLFNNGSVFRELKSGLVVPGKQTTQVLMDASSSAHDPKSFGYVWFTSGYGNLWWSTWSVSIRGGGAIWYNTHKADTDTHKDSGIATLGTTDRPKWSGTTFSYLTALANETYTAAFSGVEEPAAAPGRYPTMSGTTFPSRALEDWALGGLISSSGNPLNGTIKNFRLYSNKVLSTEELTWNRVVDEARFFGRPAPLPVTNAVVRASPVSVPADQPAGHYAVDADGFTFTAPATKTVDGRAYTLDGYTLDRWDTDAGAWVSDGAGVHAGASITVADTDLVRITWQWTGGDGLVTYDTGDYVQDGLIVMYDGIRNVGADRPHASDTITWWNLVHPGVGDVSLYLDKTAPGEWRDNGYRFEGESCFRTLGKFTIPANMTVQFATLANAMDQDKSGGTEDNSVENYLLYFSDAFTYGSLSFRRDGLNPDNNNNGWLDFACHAWGVRVDATQKFGVPYLYATATIADDVSSCFYGTTRPTTGGTSQWSTSTTNTKTPTEKVATKLCLGGIDNGAYMNLKGTICNFRFYNRVLTDAELAHNRVVDDARFWGVMPVTNVVVSSSHSFFAGNERNFNYQISGTYTFSAPTEVRTDAHGIEYALAGYTVEAWNAATQGWGAPETVSGAASYTWTDGVSPAKVRLTWQWKPTKGLRTAADYGLEDIVPAGLVLHYDGRKNMGLESLGTDNTRGALSRAWVNLANPHDFNLIRKDKTTKSGVWTADGFAFDNQSNSIGAYFQYAAPFTFASGYSLQTLIDGKVADQKDGTCGYLMFNGGTWQKAALALRTANSAAYNYSFYYVCDTAFGKETRPQIRNASREYTYGTVLVDGRTARFFEGMEPPTSGVGLVTQSTTATAQTTDKLALGGGQGGNQDFTGTLKTFRYYDRVLTADELVRNRNVDSARYFGELATTNVFVVAGGGTQTETGAYKVEGTWTFTADTVADAHGDAAAVQRYWIEELVDGKWTNRQTYDGASYTYVEGTSAATVRLTWKPQPDGTTILLR